MALPPFRKTCLDISIPETVPDCKDRFQGSKKSPKNEKDVLAFAIKKRYTDRVEIRLIDP
jgi:hypothetical protein